MEPVAIALGSNLGDRAAHLAIGVAALRERVADLVVSPFIETEPVGVTDQPRFLNGAAAGNWAGGPLELLEFLLAVEQRAARCRPWPGAARTLDLDLILFGQSVIRSHTLTVPHPRFRERAFVLEPLARIAPAMRDPVTGLSVSELWQRIKEPSSCA